MAGTMARLPAIKMLRRGWLNISLELRAQSEKLWIFGGILVRAGELTCFGILSLYHFLGGLPTGKSRKKVCVYRLHIDRGGI